MQYKVAGGGDFCSSTQLTFIELQLHGKYCAGCRELLMGPAGLEPSFPVPGTRPFGGTQFPS